MSAWPKRFAAISFSAAVLATAGLGTAPAYAQSSTGDEPHWLGELVSDCPDLYVLGMQGTTETSPDAPVKVDTGMLSNIMGPLLDQARELGASVDRAYVPYPGSFGGLTPGGTESYVESVTAGEENLSLAAQKVLSQCPSAKLAVVGFSQGAHAASNFLRSVGKGTGVVPARSVAAGALFGAPTRSPGSGLFPGTSQMAPSPVPGTRGEAVKALSSVSFTAPEGGGIGPVADLTSSYGSLSGRVSSWCQGGDLACDAPANAPVVRAVVNVAGQVEVGGDPFVAISTVGRALASTAFKTAVDVVNQDIQAPKSALSAISVQPKKTISQRLAEASDPRATPPTGQEVTAALMKVGLIGINAAVTVVKKVLTPETIAAVAAAGLANPAAAFGVLAAKTVSVLPELVPPATSQRLVRQAFQVVQNEVKANRDAFDLVAMTTVRNVAAEHGSYGSVPATASGQAPTRFAASWLAAVASDLSAAADSTTSTTVTSTATTPTTTTVRPSATTSTTPSSQTATSTTSEPAVTTTTVVDAGPTVLDQGGISAAELN
ncbi:MULTISPECIES: cutinase family protein [Rhodococcus]|uniref:cutinase family protein n=1 Tax=Rhodococcus TaxID=1827 RepID=UPI000934DAC4|nr:MULTISPECIES: cutinase family protein [Rhodococcus]MBD8056409.1 cutinase family protein [Rhodococcus ruber]QXU56802.1 cutinase family protein [Rhodococcus sp. LW-XY12]